MILDQWASQWRIPPAAMQDLRARLGCEYRVPDEASEGKSEGYAQSQVVLEASEFDVTLTRNNVGVLEDKRGVPVRYGLFNESKLVNETLKSWDLVGWRRVLIQPHMVGWTIGQFVGREVKKPGWHYTGAGRESAQMACSLMALADGCDVAFTTGRGTF